MQRRTIQRDVIRRVLEAAERPLTAQDVLDEAVAHNAGLGIATVYRNLKALVEDGWLTSVELPGEPARFELADKTHHHHFHCDDCGRVFDVPGCLDGLRQTTPKGFQLDRHEVVLYGHCAECAQA